MAAATVVRTLGVSKRYEIDDERHSDATLRDAIAGSARRMVEAATSKAGRASARDARAAIREFWALQDVSFEIAAGDVVGIIGRNGAGKSTLLKILSRITEPTSGRVGIKGRVGSLLEVGTGFHPELTGRENIFLYGSILGMGRGEIQRRFDEIIEFADIGRLLDTPIKRYSSGMQVRLAFAVAAYLEPEILLVDEVLAVGDVAFQKRCLGRMGEVAGDGRTVIFVSHNMALVQALCARGLFMAQGRLEFDGSVTDAVALYLHDIERALSTDVADRTDRRGRGESRVVTVDLGTDAGKGGAPATGHPLTVSFRISKPVPGGTCRFAFFDSLGHPVAEFRSAVAAPEDSDTEGSRGSFECSIASLPLVPGRYRIDVEIWTGTQLEDALEGVAKLDEGAGRDPPSLVGRRRLGARSAAQLAEHQRRREPGERVPPADLEPAQVEVRGGGPVPARLRAPGEPVAGLRDQPPDVRIGVAVGIGEQVDPAAERLLELVLRALDLGFGLRRLELSQARVAARVRADLESLLG
jgi:lipopolysaccharide transport system ATP-binding protein